MINNDPILTIAVVLTMAATVTVIRDDRREKNWNRHVNRALRIANNETGPRGQR